MHTFRCVIVIIRHVRTCWNRTSIDMFTHLKKKRGVCKQMIMQICLCKYVSLSLSLYLYQSLCAALIDILYAWIININLCIQDLRIVHAK